MQSLPDSSQISTLLLTSAVKLSLEYVHASWINSPSDICKATKCNFYSHEFYILNCDLKFLVFKIVIMLFGQVPAGVWFRRMTTPRSLFPPAIALV